MICTIVLAAGRSRRMGRQKLLLPLGGKPVITRIVDELQQSPVDQIFVVTGRDSEGIEQALAGREVSFVRNPEDDGDMLGSLRCGLRALPTACVGVLVVLGDQPGLSAELVAGLIESFDAAAGGIVVPVHNVHRGHPVLIAARFREELLTRYDGLGLRGLLAAHPGEVFGVAVFDRTVLEDMDTPEDYGRQVSERDVIS